MIHNEKKIRDIDLMLCRLWLVSHNYSNCSLSIDYINKCEIWQKEHDTLFLPTYDKWDYERLITFFISRIAKIKNKSENEVITMFTRKMETVEELEKSAERHAANWNAILEICSYDKKGSHSY